MDISMDNWVDQIGLEKWIWKSFVHQLSLGYISIYIQRIKNIHILLIFLYRNYPPYRWGQQPFLLIGLSKNREEVSCVTRPVAKITRVVASRLEPTRILNANRVAPLCSDTMMLMTFFAPTIGILFTEIRNGAAWQLPDREERNERSRRYSTHLVVTLVEAGQCSERRMQRQTRNGETVKAFQYGRHGESDHGPAARLMHLLYFLRGAVNTRSREDPVRKKSGEEKRGVEKRERDRGQRQGERERERDKLVSR